MKTIIALLLITLPFTFYLKEAKADAAPSLLDFVDEFYQARNNSETYAAFYKIETALKAGANPNVSDSNGITPLMRFSDLCIPNFYPPRFKYLMENVPIVMQELINYGANVNAQDSLGRTALHYSVCHPALSEVLFKNKANTTLVNNEGKNPLHSLMSRGNANSAIYGGPQPYTSILRSLIAHTDDLINQSKDGKTILMEAVFLYNSNLLVNTSLMGELFARNKDLGFELKDFSSLRAFDLALNEMDESNILTIAYQTNLTTINPNGPILNQAIQRHFKSLYQYLISLGLDPSIKDKSGMNAVMVALNQKDPFFSDAAISMLNRVNPMDMDTANSNLLQYASAASDLKAGAAILKLVPSNKLNAFVNNQNATGLTSLHYSAMQADYAFVHWLLSIGADPNLKTNQKMTAAMFAAESKSNIPGADVSVLSDLIAHQACIDSIDLNGRTALSIAVAAKKTAFTTVLQYAFSEHRNICCSKD